MVRGANMSPSASGRTCVWNEGMVWYRGVCVYPREREPDQPRVSPGNLLNVLPYIIPGGRGGPVGPRGGGAIPGR